MEIRKRFDPEVWEPQHNQLQKEHNAGMARRKYSEQGYLEDLKGVFFHLPKCGGTTLSNLWSVEDVSSLGHAPWFAVKSAMYQYAPQGQKAWDRVIKFAMVRNPWDRAVSWFYGIGVQNEPAIAEAIKGDDYELHREYFRGWCRGAGGKTMNASTFRAEGMLCKSGSGVQIDYIAKFEDFHFEVENISRLLGVDVPKVVPHENPSSLRPVMPYRFYYEGDEYLRGLVEGWGWFEVGHMGYTFE
jgi:hypothetical protein